MDFDLKRVKEYELSSQLLVFGYCREIYADAPDLVVYIILLLLHQQEHFEVDDTEFAIDETKMTITKLQHSWASAYGCTPMLVDGANSRGVYQWELQVIKRTDNIC